MDNSITNAFCKQSFLGKWNLCLKDSPSNYWGELSFDPIQGIHKLTVYGMNEIPSVSSIPVIFGVTTNAKFVSIFDSTVGKWSLNLGTKIGYIVEFIFMSYCIGNKEILSKESIRLRKYSFRCTNLEAWSKYRPLQIVFPTKKHKNLGKVVSPPDLLLYDDDFFRIKLVTNYWGKSLQTSFEISYRHAISIEAKGNRKFPYYGSTRSFSYYETVIHDFFALMIGKHAMEYQRSGLLQKKKMIVPSQISKSFPNKTFTTNEGITFFNAQKIDESWLKEVSVEYMFLSQHSMDDQELALKISLFFKHYSKYSFVLRDWIRMRNLSSITNYSLPELLYNLEGLHRSLYPECDTKRGYKETIDALHAISPYENYNRLVENRSHKLPFRQRLQDILLRKTSHICDFLSIRQRNTIIDKLVEIRNNTAHGNDKEFLEYNAVFTCIGLCENLIAFLIFLRISFTEEQINKNLATNQEWSELRQKLLVLFGEKPNE